MVTARKPRVLERDIASCRSVGRMRMMTREQLYTLNFGTVSQTMLGRFLDRTAERGHLGVERLNGNGIQVVWLTRKGADFLIDGGHADECELFPATGPVAAKDHDHHVQIVTAAVALLLHRPAPDTVLPAWTLQRLFEGKMAAIPDLLAIHHPKADAAGTALAVEIDLGGEAVRSVLTPKIRLLSAFLRSKRNVTPAILVLTSGARRAASLREALGPAADGVPIAVERLEALPSTVTSNR